MRFFRHIFILFLFLLFTSQTSRKIYFFWNKSLDALEKQEWNKAKSYLEKIEFSVRDSAWRSEIYTNLGYAYAKAGDKKKALKYLRKALLLNENNEVARRNYELLLRRLPPPPEEQQELPLDVPPMPIPKENTGRLLRFQFPVPKENVKKRIEQMRESPAYYYLMIRKNLGSSVRKTPAR